MKTSNNAETRDAICKLIEAVDLYGKLLMEREGRDTYMKWQTNIADAISVLQDLQESLKD